MGVAISVGLGGLAGWRVLQRTEARQLEAIAKETMVQRSTTYFRENLSSETTAEDIVGDYRMMSVVLNAFGLESDIKNKAFVRQILTSDLSDKKSLVNRLADKRYLKMAETLQLGSTDKDLSAISNQVTEAYYTREYERRVGESDESLRLALNARRELAGFATRESSNNTLWYEVMGNKPLRTVFEGALGFGSHIGKLPIDRQLQEFTKASERMLGTSAVKDLATPEGIEKLIKNYLARSQLTQNTAQNRYSSALTLLTAR